MSLVPTVVEIILSPHSSPDHSVMAEAQRVCSAGIEEASRVGSALESGVRSCCHGQHEAALAAASRALEIAPQCAEAQEMRVRIKKKKCAVGVVNPVYGLLVPRSIKPGLAQSTHPERIRRICIW